MKVPPVGWAFFGLAVLVLAGYVLNRGVLVGSDTRHEFYTMSDGTIEAKYVKYCNYLHFGGSREDSLWGNKNSADAEKEICRMFDD